MKKITSSSLFFLFLAISFIFALFCLKNGGEDSHFQEISDEIVADSFQKDSISMQFSFQDPKQFGLSEETCSLPLYNREEYLSAGTLLDETIESLEKIDPNHLSDSVRTTYEVLLPYLQQQRLGTDFPYYEEPLSPTSGIHISLPVLLAEFPVENEQDIETYLSVLSLMPSYLGSIADFEADKAALGMFMASEDADLVISQCEFFSSEKGKAFFTENFSLLLEKINSDDKDLISSYFEKHSAILTEQICPAYQKLADSVLLLKEPGKERKGLSQYAKGEAYYEHLVRQLVGTDASISEIEQKLYIRLEDLYEKLSKFRASYKKGSSQPSSSHAKSLTVSNCLPVLQEELKPLFPLPDQTSNVTIKEIPDALKDFTAPAYYFVPSIAICRKGNISSIQNTIYVRPDLKQNPVDLFTTLAHEGFPGHMYQNVYFLSTQGVNRENVLRYCMNFPGYSEGWALYTELLSFSYADGDETYLELLRISREIQLCLLCILDIRIHRDEADVSDISPYLARIGIKEPTDVEQIFTYLINEPGTYLKYYVGYLELLDCKELYQRKCMSQKITYSELDFHTFFLTHGPDSYVNIKKEIKQ